MGLAAAAVVLIALTIALWTVPDVTAPAAPVATLAAVTGELEIRPPEGFSRTAAAETIGSIVVSSTRLRTGPNGRAAFELVDGGSLRLDVATRVRLTSAGAIELDRGAVYIDTDGRAPDAAVEVRTQLGVARDIGTRFEVRRPDESLIVRVRGGRVVVDRGGAELVVTQGTGVTLGEDGSRSVDGVRADGPEWDWAQRIAPPFEIEGRTAASFLRWASRETGRSVRFADADVERLATGAVLHGSIEGLTPHQALDAVLPGCGLEAVRRPGVLVVQRAGSDGGPAP